MILKRNFLLVLLVLVFSNNLKAQVGINTTTPASSLDVVGEPTIVTTSDGILAPRITGDQLRAKTAYGADQEGALIYVTVADSAPAGQTINVTASGYYYFDGLVWQANNVAVGTAENIYTTDGTLTTNRAVTQNNFDLNFDANTLVISGDDNRVGLGTITPRARLEISGAPAVGATIPPLTDAVTPASTEYSVVISNSDNATVGTVQGFSTASGGFDSYLQARNFVDGNVYNLLLNPLGANVGIGTTIPTQRLTIDGNITTVQDGQRILFPHSNAVDFNDGTIGSAAFSEGLNIVGTQTVAGNGRVITTFGTVVNQNSVGVGNVVPTSVLDVNGDARVRNIPAGADTDIVVTADADGNLRQRTAAQIVAAGGGIDADGDAWGVTGEDITSNIGRTGNVGIGTTTPRAGLELSKTPAIGATVRPLSEAVNVANSSNYNLVLSNSDNATVGAVSGFSTEAGGFNTYLQARGFATNGPAYNLLLNPLGANVGIGTTIPTQRLTIDGNITTVQDGQRILFPHSNAVDGNDGTIGSGAFEEGLNIVGTQTVAGNGRRITTLGTVVHQNNVGIGNVVPTSFLDVNGDARVRNIPAGVAADGILTTDADGNIRQRTLADVAGAGADGDAWAVTGEDVTTAIGRTGDVGIGITAPTQKLQVDGNQTFTSDGNFLRFPNTNQLDGNDGVIGGGVFEEGLNIVGVQTVAGNGRRITTFGDVVNQNRVGIGNVVPTSFLDVNGDARVRNIPAGAATDIVVTADANGNIRQRTAAQIVAAGGGIDADGDAWGVTGEDITSNIGRTGNVGIGITVPTQRLQVDGNQTFTSDGNFLRFPNTNQTDGNDGIISAGLFQEGLNIVGVQTVAGNGRRITTFGDVVHLNNVGIGNVVPTSALDVNGTTRVRNIPAGAAADIVITADADGNLRQRTAAQIVAAGGGIDADGDAWGVTGEDITSNIGRIGNVGIGTTTPRAGLELSKTAAIGATVRPLTEAVDVANSDNYNLVLSNSDNATVGAVSGFSNEAGGFNTYLQARGFAANGPAYNLLFNPVGGNVGVNNVNPVSPFTVGITSNGSRFMGDARIGNANGDTRAALVVGEDAANNGFIVMSSNNSASFGQEIQMVNGQDNGNSDFMRMRSTNLEVSLQGALRSGGGNDSEFNLVARNNIVTLSGESNNNTSAINFVGANIGIDNTNPTASVDINGDARVRNIPAGAAADNIVTTDADGNLRQRTAAQIVAAGGGNLYTSDGTIAAATNRNITLADRITSKINIAPAGESANISTLNVIGGLFNGGSTSGITVSSNFLNNTLKRGILRVPAFVNTNPTVQVFSGDNTLNSNLLSIGGINSISQSSPTQINFRVDGDMDLTNTADASSLIAMTIKGSSGNVGIGTLNPTDALDVVGNIRATGNIIVQGAGSNIPDYVFEKYFNGVSALNPDYKMMSLEEIEAFTKENNHLPGVQNVNEVKENGLLVNELSRTNLEKVEELFLHTIEQNKEITEIKKENKALRNELDDLKKVVKLLLEGKQ